MKEFEIIEFEKGDFLDNFGNLWTTVAFLGEQESAKWVMKPENADKVTIGDKVWGELTVQKSKAGKEYLRFKKANKDQLEAFGGSTGGSTGKSGEKPTEEYWDDKNASIKAQFAIKTAVAYGQGQDFEMDTIEALAKDFYNMIDRVKDPAHQTKEIFLGAEVVE